MANELFSYEAKLGFNMKEFSDGMKKSESSWKDFTSKLSTFGSGVAKGVGAAIGAVSTATTALIGTTTQQISELAAAGDAIDKASQKAHMSAEAYQEWDFILQHCGSDASVLQGTMNTLTSAIDSGSDAFAELGINIEDLEGMNPEDVFGLVIESLQGMEDETQRTALATKLLGKGGTEMAALLNTSAEDVAAMKEEVHSLGGVLSTESVQAAAAFQDNLQNMNTAITGIKNGILSQFIGPISTAMEGFTAIFTGESSGLEKVKQGIDGFVEKLSGMASQALEIGTTILVDIGQAITDNAGTLISAGADAVMSLLNDGIIPLLPQFAEVAIQAVESVSSSLGGSLSTLIPTIVDCVLQIGNVLLTDGLPVLLQATTEILSGIGEGLLNSFPLILDQLPVLAENVISFITGSADMLISAAVSLIDGLISFLPTGLEALISALPSILSAIFTTISEQAPALLQSALSLIQELCAELPNTIMLIVSLLPELIGVILDSLLGDGLPALIDCVLQMTVMLAEQLPTIVLEIIKILPELISSVISALMSASDKFAEAGVSLFVCLIQNLPEILSKLCEAAGKLISGILDTIKAAFTSLRSIGGDLLSKIKEGFESKKQLAFDSIKNIGNAIIEAIKGIFSGAANIGKSLIDGLVNGVKNAASNAVSAVTSVASDIWSSITGFFGVHSPSTKLAWVGEMLMQGLSSGIDDGSEDAIKAAERMTDALGDELSSIGGVSIKPTVDTSGIAGKIKSKFGLDNVFGNFAAGAIANPMAVASSLGLTPGGSSTINNGGDTYVTQEFKCDIAIDHVENYDDFVAQARKDSKFEKMVQAMTVDRINGGGAFGKYKPVLA